MKYETGPLLCDIKSEVILLEDRLKPNDCPDYKRILADADKGGEQ